MLSIHKYIVSAVIAVLLIMVYLQLRELNSTLAHIDYITTYEISPWIYAIRNEVYELSDDTYLSDSIWHNLYQAATSLENIEYYLKNNL